MVKNEIKKKETKKESPKTKVADSVSVPMVNHSGEISGQAQLPKAIFDQKLNQALINQAIRVYFDNQKTPTATVKTRAEVSGGGRKPWRQKGTGRARVGSIRVPNWRGGGVVFGPSNQKRKLILPEKMREKALAVALSDRVRSQSMAVIKDANFKQTKLAVKALDKMPLKEKRRLLIVLENGERESIRALRNIENLQTVRGLDLNTLHVVESSGLIFTAQGLEELKNRFSLGKEGQNDQ